MRGRSGIAARDRLWLDARSVLVLDGLDVPSPEAIRAALRRWAAVSPRHPVFRLLTPERPGWRRPGGAALDEHCDAMVVPLADDDVTDPDDLATTLYRNRPDVPMRFAAGRRLLGFNLEHAMFDAWGAHRVFAAVIRAAATGTVPEDFLGGSTRTPLLTAVARAARQDPRRLARTLRGPRPSPPVAATGSTPASAGVVPWSPAPRLVSARSGPDTLGALRAWRRGAPRGATVQTLLFAAARAALEAADLSPRLPGLYTLVDNRRYLDPDTRVAGNFSIPIYLDPADPTDPAAVGASLTAQLDAGVPLVTMAAWLAHAARERGGSSHPSGEEDGQPAPGAPVDRAQQPAPVPILNHLGRMRLLDPFPWHAGGTDARYRALVTQGGPEDLTVYLTELGGRLNVCIGFHDNVFDTDRVRSVADALAADPVGLVTRQPVRQR